MVTLDIGCGPFKMPFKGKCFRVDLRKEVKPDAVGTALRLPFQNEVFNEVYASHLLEHFTYADGYSLLFEIKRTLKPTGILRLAVPNLQWALCNLDSPEGMKVIYGKQDAPWNVHKWGYTPESLVEIVEKCQMKVSHVAIQHYQTNVEARKE